MAMQHSQIQRGVALYVLLIDSLLAGGELGQPDHDVQRGVGPGDVESCTILLLKVLTATYSPDGPKSQREMEWRPKYTAHISPVEPRSPCVLV